MILLSACIGGTMAMLFGLMVFLFIILLPLIALIDILRSEFTENNKLIWVIVVLLFPFLGAVLYFLIGMKQKV